MMWWLGGGMFTPYWGGRVVAKVKAVEGGHDAIYSTPTYERFRRLIRTVVDYKWFVGLAVVAMFFAAVFGMRFVEQQFFPRTDRPELLVDINLPPGAALSATEATVSKIEKVVASEPEALVVTSYIRQGSPRFVLASDPLLPNPA